MAHNTQDIYTVVKTREVRLAGIVEDRYNVFEILALSLDREILIIGDRPCVLYDSDLEFIEAHCREMNDWVIENDLYPDYAGGVERERAIITERSVDYIQSLRSGGRTPVEIEYILGDRGW